MKKIKDKDVVNQQFNLDRVQAALQILGHKILLKNYECTLGTVDFVTKRAGNLIFIFINRSLDEKKSGTAAATYYLKRYGVVNIESKLEFYEVAQ